MVTVTIITSGGYFNYYYNPHADFCNTKMNTNFSFIGLVTVVSNRKPQRLIKI